MKRFVYFFLTAILLLAASCGINNAENTVSDNKISNESSVSLSQSESLTGFTASAEKEDSLISSDEGESVVSDAIDREHYLEVHFIDVGQGDSTLIICDGEAMIIDAGGDSKGTAVQLYLKKQEINLLIM